MTNIEIDALSREKIVTETDKNFFVEAGAGSGKTTMLVNRMAAMVEAGIDISKICAITFTKAAAGEFYERFQKLLIERSNPDYVWEDKGFAGQLPKPTEETRKRCAQALINIDLCFMGTIDSFCSMVLSEHPSEAGIPSDSTIISDMEAENLYKQIYVNICAGEYGDELKSLANTFNSLFRDAQKVFVEGVGIFMNNRNVQFNFAKRDGGDIDKLFANDKSAINRALKCLMDHPEFKYEGNKDSVAAWEKLNERARRLRGKWSNDFSGILYAIKGLGGLRVLPQAQERYSTSLEGVFEPGGKQGKWLEFVPAGELLNKLNNICYEVSMTFISECVPILEDVMRQKGAMTYFDYLYYLRNMLRNDAAGDGKLINYIYNRHSYFLIDEFQDTNPLQAEVFFYLSATRPEEQWSKCAPRQGSLFIVGDPKQSIYRFRSADVTSFLKVKKLFKENGGEILNLSRNFRSTKVLCNYFNKVFSEMLPSETEVQSKFEEIPLPDNGKEEFQGVFKYSAYTGSLEVEHPEESDSKQIRKIIQGLVGKATLQVSVEGNLRPIKYSDIMVITYGKGKINGIMEALDEAEIPMRVEGKVPFERNEALIQIHALYSAVANPEDNGSLYLALISSFFGISEEEMMKYRLAGGKITLKVNYEIPDTAEDSVKKVADAILKIKELSFKATGLSPAALFTEIMEGFKVYNIAHAENLEVLYYTLELLRNAEKTGTIISLKDGAGYIGKLLSGQAEEERCLSLNEDKDCVHIANLHKVKGLEAPIVILAAATQFRNNITTRIIHKDTGSEGYIFDVQGEMDEGNKFSYFKTEEFENEKEDEKIANNAEHDRLLYVGATRARNALIICASICKVGKSESARSIWKPLLEKTGEDIFDVIVGTEGQVIAKREEVDAESLYDLANVESVFNNRDAGKNTYQIENPSHVKVPSKMTEEIVETNETMGGEEADSIKRETGIKDADIHRFPALLGTMVHRLMEVMVSSKSSFNADRVVDEIIREYSTPANKPYEEKLRTTLVTVAEAMSKGGYHQENKAPKDLLKVLSVAEDVCCEVPFCYKEEEDGNVTVWNGIMDLIYCESGKWHIIDYKTNIEGDNLDKKYEAQLEAYKKAFKEITGNEADAYTYHIEV